MALVFVLAFDRGIVAAALQMAAGAQAWANGPMPSISGQTALLQLLHMRSFISIPRRTTIVFGPDWAEWSPVWHWLEPALLVAVCIVWGWLLFTLVERPAGGALRRYFAGDDSAKRGVGLTLCQSALGHTLPTRARPFRQGDFA